MFDKKWLVIGATSTAGAYFVKVLGERINSKITIASRKDPKEAKWKYPFLFYRGSLRSDQVDWIYMDINAGLEQLLSTIRMVKPEIIINFASLAMVGQSWLNPEDWYRTNVLGQANLIQAIAEYGRCSRYLHFTTPEVYGDVKNYVREGGKFNPSTPYAASRAAGDLITRMWAKQYGIHMIGIRASSIYCEGQHLYRVIPRSLLCCIKGIPLIIDGDGTTARQYVHMEDVSKAIFVILEKAESGEGYSEYHISSSNLMTVREIVELSAKLTGYDINELPISFGEERQGIDKQYLLNDDKIRSLGWREELSMEAGISRVAKWIKGLPEKALSELRYVHRP